MAHDLGVPETDIRSFLTEAQRVLQSNRAKTHYGEDISYHWFYLGLQADNKLFPTIVTIEVRREKSEPHVYLTEVRRPTSEEFTEMGLQAEPDEDEFPTADAMESVRAILEEAKANPPQTIEQPRRMLLAHDGSTIANAYVLGPWTISPEPESASGPLFSEKIVYCDRMVGGTNPFDINVRVGHHFKQLGLLLDVLWISHFYEIRAEHRWTVTPYHDDASQLQLKNDLKQLGYSAAPLLAIASVDDPGPTRSIDRLSVRSWGITVSEPFTPPDDAGSLFALFESAEIKTAQRFLEAAKAYNTAHVIWPTTVTGAISYLVVAAESLMELNLPVCEKCGQHQGVSKAFRDLFFTELPCLKEDEPQANRLLKEAYAIRSRHFHDARFLAGELQEWHPVEILMPDAMAYRSTWEKMLGLVNGLLVAYLVRKTTGSQWERALAGFPDWKESQMFSVSMTLGGSPPAPETSEEPPSA